MNNRQNGRRRGRGGQQARNGQPGGPDRGNRLDNRARGNAAQLLEKYKTLARDAQMQGDRVNTEYYLQFADHYFRVLSENRSRFEEQQNQRRPQQDYRDEFGDDDGGEGQRADQGQDDGQGDDGWEGERAEPRREFQPRRDERRGYDAEANNEGEPRRRNGGGNGGNGHAANGNGGGQPNGNGFTAPDFLSAEAPRIELERVPPAIGAEGEEASGEGEEAPVRRRRPRRPRGEAAPVEA